MTTQARRSTTTRSRAKCVRSIACGRATARSPCWRTGEIRALLESTGLVLDDWQRARTDRVLIREWAPLASAG
jgi:hypothetical protein